MALTLSKPGERFLTSRACASPLMFDFHSLGASVASVSIITQSESTRGLNGRCEGWMSVLLPCHGAEVLFDEFGGSFGCRVVCSSRGHCGRLGNLESKGEHDIVDVSWLERLLEAGPVILTPFLAVFW